MSYAELYSHITDHPLGGVIGSQIEEELLNLIHGIILEDMTPEGLNEIKREFLQRIFTLEMWVTIMKEILANPTWEMPAAKTALMQDPGIQELHDELIRNSESDVKEK